LAYFFSTDKYTLSVVPRLFFPFVLFSKRASESEVNFKVVKGARYVLRCKRLAFGSLRSPKEHTYLLDLSPSTSPILSFKNNRGGRCFAASKTVTSHGPVRGFLVVFPRVHIQAIYAGEKERKGKKNDNEAISNTY
jgi:hypothetical protein